MPYADWAAVTRALSIALESLADREFIIMGEPPRDAEVRRGLFGRRPQPAPTRYVQVMRFEEVLFAECVGATSLGGTWAMEDPTIERLRGLGWLTAAETRAEFGSSAPNFEQYVDLDSSHGLPDLLVASLAVLGALPDMVALESSGGAEQVG